MRWVIQDGVFGDETEALKLALDKLNVSCTVGMPDSVLGGSTVFVRGTTGFINEFTLRFGEYVDVVCSPTMHNYRYDVYAKHYLSRLLNSSFAIYPWWYLKGLDFILSPIFVLPLVGDKIFTGTTVGTKYYHKELEVIENLPSTCGLTDETLVVLSSDKSQDILCECRLIMRGNKCLAWDFYNETERLAPIDPKDFFDVELIQQWFTWTPDEFFVADVALTPDGWKLVEINGLASAGWYDISPTPIIQAIEERYS